MRRCFAAIISLCLLSWSCPLQAEYTDLESYYKDLNTSCQTDSDCAIKDVRNCCGYFPKCLNKSAPVDPKIVAQICSAQGMLGICGHAEISLCTCQDKHCTAATSSEIAR